MYRFNPRPRAGGDAEVHRCALLPIHVSIHAPARGATSMHFQVLRLDKFQSTPPRGGRHCKAKLRITNSKKRSFRASVVYSAFIPYSVFKEPKISSTIPLRYRPARTPGERCVRLGFAPASSGDQRPFLIDTRFCAHVLNPSPPI